MELLVKLAKGNIAPRLLVTILLAVFLVHNSSNHADLKQLFPGWQLTKTAQAAPTAPAPAPSIATKNEPNKIIVAVDLKTLTASNPSPGKNPSSAFPNSKTNQAKPDYTELVTALAKTDHITLLKKAKKKLPAQHQKFHRQFQQTGTHQGQTQERRTDLCPFHAQTFFPADALAKKRRGR